MLPSLKPPVLLAAACRVLLLALVVSVVPARAQAPDYVSIDHIEFFVSDLERSLRFYTRVFGTDLWKNRQTERRYLLLGNSYLALEAREEARMDHLCLGIEPFDIAALHGWLDHQGLPWVDYPSGRDLRVDDRNGIRTQLARHDTWAQLAGTTAEPEARPVDEPAVFHPLAIDEIFLTVDDLEVDALFYARMLNQTGTLQAGSLWFRVGDNARLRLTQTPVGQSPGINYFAVLVANTDLDVAADAVFAAGGIIETILPNGFSFWDPDGHRVVVRTTDQF